MAIYITVRPGGFYESEQLPHVGVDEHGNDLLWKHHKTGMVFKSTMTEHGRKWVYQGEAQAVRAPIVIKPGDIYMLNTRAPVVRTLNDLWIAPDGIAFKWTERKGHDPVWIASFENNAQLPRPAERDVPHWAQSNVAAFRIAWDLPDCATDRMIFAALVDASTDPAAYSLSCTRLIEWAKSQEYLQPPSAPVQCRRSNASEADKAAFEEIGRILKPRAIPSDVYLAFGYRKAFFVNSDGERMGETFDKTWMDRAEDFPQYSSPIVQPPAINGITQADVDAFKYWGGQNDHGHTCTLDYYQEIATKSAIYPGKGTPLGLIYVALKMNGEAGELAEHVGKAMRDDDLITVYAGAGYGAWNDPANKLTPERRKAIIKEIGDCLWYLSAACNELGLTLSEAAAENLQKLADRTVKGTLQGSGDDR